MADYNANIRVSADTKKAESEISKLQTRLNQISDFSLKLNSKDIGRQVNQIGQQLRGIGERGLLGGLTLAAGKSVTALSALGAKLGVVGAAAAAAGGTINSALGGLPGVISEILGQVGQIPNAFGLAAVAAMAFAPQLTKAAASAVGLGAAVDKAVGAKATQGIASAVAGVTQLNTQLNATQATFAGLLSNDPLNKLVAQLRDAQKQVGEYQAFSEGSFEAVEQLLTVERLVTKEKRAQAALYSQLNSEARQLKAQVQQNVIASRNSRSGSGFNSFSSVASALEGSSAVDKAIRRNYEKRIRNAPPAPSAPLMLPSSEMLFSGNRRIERLTADPGLQAGRGYTEAIGKAAGGAKELENRITNTDKKLRAAVTTSLELDGIFTQVSKAMSATAEGAAKGNRITQSWLKALREMAQIKDDIVETTAREVALQQKAAATETANKRKAFGRQAESLALGVGFPLLFGGGPGAVGGAALGSFVGSGFGGQILGGAIGQALDQFAQGVAKVGSAMRAPIANFKELADANLLAGKAQTTYIQKLIEAGRTAEASALIQAEITKKIGVQGMKDLQNAGAASDKLNKAMATLGLQMQAAVAGPLAGFLSWLAQVVSIGAGVNSTAARQSDIFGGLGKRDQATLKAQEARILSGANLFNEAQKRAQVAKLYEGYAPRATIGSASAPGTTVESQQARATTQELQKQVELGRANLNLAGLTLEKDGARYVAAAKNVALQELDNKLLEIKNSWIGKIFDKERNLAMIRSANLEYQAKLQQINAQVAQKSLGDQQAQLQAQLAFHRQYSEAIEIDIRRVEVEKGIESALERRVRLGREIQIAALNALDTEREIALKEAAKNGTLELTLLLYSRRREALENETYINDRINRQKLEEYRIQKAINENKKTTDFAQQMQGIFAQVPMSRTPLEQLQYDQAQRRGSLLNPKFQERADIQLKMTDKSLIKGSDRAKELQQELSRVNDEIGKMTTALNYLDSQERVWMKQRGGVEAMHDSINGVGTAIRDGLGQALIMAVGQTENLAEAMQGLAANIVAAIGQMLILNAIKAGLSGLAGNDGVGLFSILSGTFGKKAANGAYWPGGFQAFADGGMVTRPTMGLVGEGGQPEYIIPASKMRGAMERYASGARGAAVIPGSSDLGSGDSAAPAAAGGAIDVRYTVERINSVDYVTADQFQRGMQQAAQQGAAQGERRAIKTLQASRSTRSRIGLR